MKKENQENLLKKRKKTTQPGNIPPRCQHFGTCGGCQWQNLAYEDQLKMKEELVQKIFEAADIKEGKWKPMIGCDNPWKYRNKIELSFGQEENEELRLGFHLPKRRYELFDVEECHLMRPYAAFIAGKIREFMRKNDVSVYHFRRNEGFLRTLFIREGKHTGEWMLNLVGSKDRFDLESQLRDLVVTESEKFFEKGGGKNYNPKLVSFYLTRMIVQKGQRTRLEEKLIYGKPVIREKLKVVGGPRGNRSKPELNFEISPQSFFQPNTFQAEKLYETVLQMASLTGKEIVYDLFCGTGTISLCLASQAKKVYGIEVEKKAIENAVENARRNRIANVEFAAGDVGKRIFSMEEKPDLMVLDPPRAGVAKKTLLKIIEFKCPRLVYVSCNPESLARDVKLLQENGYKLEIIQPVDMFPQTRHIECVARIKKKGLTRR